MVVVYFEMNNRISLVQGQRNKRKSNDLLEQAEESNFGAPHSVWRYPVTMMDGCVPAAVPHRLLNYQSAIFRSIIILEVTARIIFDAA